MSSQNFEWNEVYLGFPKEKFSMEFTISSFLKSSESLLRKGEKFEILSLNGVLLQLCVSRKFLHRGTLLYMSDTPKILIVCALYIEAKPFITSLNLKPQPAPSGFQIFENSEIALLITRTGKLASASGTTFVINKYENADIVCANVGICGAKNEEVGTLFLIDKITDQSSGRSYYPDIIYPSNFERNTLHTVDTPDQHQSFEELVDMEGSGFFEAASNFLSAEKIQLLKIVSDYADTQHLDTRQVEQILLEKVPQIMQYLHTFPKEKGAYFSLEEKKQMTHLFACVHFSQSQKIQYKKLIKSLAVQGEDIVKIVAHNIKETSAAKILSFLRQQLEQY